MHRQKLGPGTRMTKEVDFSSAVGYASAIPYIEKFQKLVF